MAGIEMAKMGHIKHILIDPTSAITVGAIVSTTGLLPDADGNYVLKAGTPVGGTALDGNRQTALTSAGSPVVGIVLSDVEYDLGDTEVNATIVINGCIDVSKLDADVKAKITDDVKGELTAVTFVNGRNEA